MKWVLLLAVWLWPLSHVAAQEAQRGEKLPEELAVTRSVVLQDADEFQSSVRFDQYEFHVPFFERKATVAAEFEYGLTDRWELDTEVPYRFRDFNHVRSFDGIGDIETAVRYGVIPINEKPVALTAGLGVILPTGDRKQALGDGRLTLEPFLTASTWLGPVNVQVGGGWTRAVTSAGNEPLDEYEYNVAIVYPIDRWFLVLEGNGTSTRDSMVYYVTPELIWKPTDHLEFLVGVPLGVTRDSADYGVVASVTVEWENLTRRNVEDSSPR